MASSINLIFRLADGNIESISADPQVSVMEAATAAGIPGIVAECRGSLSCGTCRIRVPASLHKRLPPASEMEQELLSLFDSENDHTRLSCQLRVLSEMEGEIFEVPDSQY